MITKEGEVRPSEYLDHRGNQVITLDHFRQQVVGQRAIRPGGKPLSRALLHHPLVLGVWIANDSSRTEEINADGEPVRKALSHALDDYVNQHYPNGTGAVYCPVGGTIERYSFPLDPEDGRTHETPFAYVGSLSLAASSFVMCISCGAFQPHNYWNGIPSIGI